MDRLMFRDWRVEAPAAACGRDVYTWTVRSWMPILLVGLVALIGASDPLMCGDTCADEQPTSAPVQSDALGCCVWCVAVAPPNMAPTVGPSYLQATQTAAYSSGAPSCGWTQQVELPPRS